jgi:G3E family GTPase
MGSNLTQEEDGPPMLVDSSRLTKTDSLLGENVKVPITVVTGYLGSGKSTLLNYIATQKEKKIAVILNEFGDTSDIEKSLSVQQGNSVFEEWIELDNGCLCCTVKDSGVIAIENLLNHRGRFDYILLETTGVADPGPIATMFWLDEALKSNIYLDGVVTVVDGTNIVQCLDDVTSDSHGKISDNDSDGTTCSTAQIQVAHADVLIVNKMDKIDQPTLNKIEQRLRAINSIAPIVSAQYGQVALNNVVDLKAYDDKSIDVRSFSTGWHDHRISTVSINLDRTTEEQEHQLESWLQKLLWEPQGGIEIHRVKGKLIRPDNTVKIIQGVRETYEIIEIDDKAQENDQGKLVLIGKGLKEQQIRQNLSKIMGSGWSQLTGV